MGNLIVGMDFHKFYFDHGRYLMYRVCFYQVLTLV